MVIEKGRLVVPPKGRQGTKKAVGAQVAQLPFTHVLEVAASPSCEHKTT